MEATRAQLEEALQSAANAGDTAAANEIADYIYANYGAPEPPPEAPQRPYGEQVSQRFGEFTQRNLLDEFSSEYERRTGVLSTQVPESPYYPAHTAEPPLMDKFSVGVSQAARTAGDAAISLVGTLVSDSVREGASELWRDFSQTEFGKAGLSAMSKGVAAWNEFSENHPQAAEKIGTYIDVATFFAPTRASLAEMNGEKYVPATRAAARRQRAKASQLSIEERRAGIQRLMMPLDLVNAPGKIGESGPFRTGYYVPTDRENTINLTLETVNGVDPRRTARYNWMQVDNAVTEADKDLIEMISNATPPGVRGRRGPATSFSDLTDELQDELNFFLSGDEFIKLTGEAQKKTTDFANKALQLLDARKGPNGTISAMDLLELRREFDDFLYGNQRQGASFIQESPDITSAKGAAGNFLRTFLNDKLKQLTPGDEAHNYLDRMHNLLSAKPLLRQKAAQEANNAFTRIWSTLKEKLNLPQSSLGLIALSGIGTQAITEQTALAAGAAALTAAGLHTMRKRNRVAFYAATLNKIDEAIELYSSDKNLVNSLRLDRAIVVDYMHSDLESEDGE